MSKPSMKILRDMDGHGYTIYDDMDVGDVIHKSEFWVRADRLHLLVSCASAALAEQNSRVMSTCKCDLSEYKDAIPPCPSFTCDPSELDECQTAIKGGGICAHGRDCHAQNTENQGEGK